MTQKGFAGLDCMNNFCNYKEASFKEKAYLDLAIKNVCGTERCFLDEKNEFKCDCLFRLQSREDGLCELKKPCLPDNLGYEKCTKNQSNFCIIQIDDLDNGFKWYDDLNNNKTHY